MSNPPYEFEKEHAYRYTFKSTGKQVIDKVVEFTPTAINRVYNLAFGDQLPNGEIDDKANSNNGDIIKIFATVIGILQDFTWHNPSFKVMFLGSTALRTKLYKRILKVYYQSFTTLYYITGLIEIDNEEVEIPFDPKNSENYRVFFIK